MNRRRTIRGGGRQKIPRLEPTAVEQPRPFTTKGVKDCHLHLLDDGKFSDVTFIVGEGKERISCHQLFLKARSSVFEVLFSERWSQNTCREIQLEDVHPEIFKMFLLFVYTDKLKMDETDVEVVLPEALELLQLARKYNVKQLVNKCEELLESKVTLDHALDLFQAAQIYELAKLKETIGTLWARSLSELQVHESFAQLDEQTLMYILKREDLDMREVDIFHLALQWAETQPDAPATESLQCILPLIRFPTMTMNEFTTAVVPTEVLPLSTVLQLFTYFGNDDSARRSLAGTLGFSTQSRQPKHWTEYINIYSQDNRTGTTKLKKFGYLKECLQFCEFDEPLTQSNDLCLGIRLSAITFNCPAAPERASPSFKTFKISLKHQNCHIYEYDFYSDQRYTEFITLASVVVEEGTTTDVEFDTMVSLKKRTMYCITIEEVIDDDEAMVVQSYKARDFGPGPAELVTVTVKNRVRTSLVTARNFLDGFWKEDEGSRFKRPKLICRLGFQGL